MHLLTLFLQYRGRQDPCDGRDQSVYGEHQAALELASRRTLGSDFHMRQLLCCPPILVTLAATAGPKMHARPYSYKNDII